MPAGCSGDLATSVLVDPVLSSAPIKRWAGKGATVTTTGQDTCTVKYVDSTSGVYEYSYRIDTKAWVIVSMVKQYAYFSTYYTAFWGTYVYTSGPQNEPVPAMVAFNGDTTLARGGYRFFNVAVNEELPESLFVSVIRHADRRFDFDPRRGVAQRMAQDGSAWMVLDARGRMISSGTGARGPGESRFPWVSGVYFAGTREGGRTRMEIRNRRCR